MEDEIGQLVVDGVFDPDDPTAVVVSEEWVEQPKPVIVRPELNPGNRERERIAAMRMTMRGGSQK